LILGADFAMIDSSIMYFKKLIKQEAYTKTKRQKKPEEAKRSPESFLKESCIGSIGYPRILPFIIKG